MGGLGFRSDQELLARPLSPFKFRVLPTHDASKVRASGPGLTSGVPASFPVEFSIDTKDAGQGQLSVLITVSTEPDPLTHAVSL